MGVCSVFSLYPEFLNPSTLTFHSLLGFDLLSSIPSPPQLPNSSGMHLRNVLREEELPGRGTWERGGCCSSIKLEGQGSRVCRPEQDQETSIHPACALFFSISPSALPWVLSIALPPLTLSELYRHPLRTSLGVRGGMTQLPYRGLSRGFRAGGRRGIHVSGGSGGRHVPF